MIAKISIGNYTAGMVKYNHSKTTSSDNKEAKAKYLGANAITDTSENGIIQSIVRQNNLNSTVSKPNIHISLNFHKNDILSDHSIMEITNSYMERLGYQDQPYGVYRHFDTDHPHVHIVSSQINLQGKKIDDSYLYLRSQKITRDLELQYKLTKALEMKSTLSNQTPISELTSDYLNNDNGELIVLLERIISDVLSQRPTDIRTFDYLLKKHQVLRENSSDNKGHFFKLVALEEIEQTNALSKHLRIKGSEFKDNYSLPSIEQTLKLNQIGKTKLLPSMRGRFFAIHDTISEPISLSDFILKFQKKGIKVSVKRRQTGDRVGAINGLSFIDMKTNFSYSATDLKIKSIDLIKKIIDDQLNVVNTTDQNFIVSSEIEHNETQAIELSATNNIDQKPYNSSVNFTNIVNSVLDLFETHSPYEESQVDLKAKKKKRRKKK